MSESLSAEEARAALAAVDQGRRRVIEEVALPSWYWGGLAAGWVVLGVIADSGHPVLSSIATFLFGAVHASIASRVLDGRHGSSRLAVRYGVVTPRLPLIVIGFLLLMGALTVLGALLVHADGAAHAATITSVAVAGVVLFGGPQLVAVVRRRAARAA